DQYPQPDGGGVQARTGGDPLPLHRLSQHRQGGARRGQDEGRQCGDRGGGFMSATLTSDGRSGSTYVGQAMRRKEDPRMVRGRGRYIDDIVVPGMLWVAIV